LSVLPFKSQPEKKFSRLGQYIILLSRFQHSELECGRQPGAGGQRGGGALPGGGHQTNRAG